MVRDLHDELGRLVADAYGWPWPMETEELLARLVPLHDERIEAERRGTVRWLRPEYQVPRFGDRVEADDAVTVAPAANDTSADDSPDWPDDAIEQLTALREVIGTDPRTAEEIVGRFQGANRAVAEKHIEMLAVLGVVVRDKGGGWIAQGGSAGRSVGALS